MNIQLSDHFTYKKLLRFSFPPIVMMIFTSIYGVIDGLFVSNFIKDGGASFEAVNFIMPYLMILGVVGFMFGTGGGALIKGLAKRLNAKTNLPFIVAEDPLRAVVRGTGIALKNVNRFSFLMR